MARTNDATVTVDCPDCHEAVQVGVKMVATSVDGHDGPRLVLSVEPDVSAMAEHFALDHA